MPVYGIALAGANVGIYNGSGTGLLSPDKIAKLQLQGTDLVVLSACDTGVGQINKYEGIIGLRRMFLIAGAKTVIVSMWPIPDKETTTLMSRFYKEYLSHKPKAWALRLAALDQKKKYPHPFFWGAFICLGSQM